MGFVEYFDETTGVWTNIEDVPLYDTINCQLCNEPTEAHDIVAEIHFKDDQPVVGIEIINGWLFGFFFI